MSSASRSTSTTSTAVDALLRPGTGLLSNVHEFPWEEAQTNGISFKALVAPQVASATWIVVVAEIIFHAPPSEGVYVVK